METRGYPDQTSTILFPKGIRDISTILKCCLPKGMPIIVMKRISPKTICVMAIHIPPHKIQIIFNKRYRQPEEDEESLTTSLPKGQSVSAPNLKHCNPNGIPIIVKHNISPPKK